MRNAQSALRGGGLGRLAKACIVSFDSFTNSSYRVSANACAEHKQTPTTIPIIFNIPTLTKNAFHSPRFVPRHFATLTFIPRFTYHFTFSHLPR
jgi:hypothetical protein